MMSLFDEEQIMKSFIKSERYEAVQESAKEIAKQMMIDGEIPIEKIVKYVPSLSMEELKKLEVEVMQLV